VSDVLLMTRRLGRGCVPDGPILTEAPRVDLVVKGMRLVLQCAADANPPVTYTWIKVHPTLILTRYGHIKNAEQRTIR